MIRRRFWIVYVVVGLAIAMMPFMGHVDTVSAADIASGYSGDCKWVIDSSGTLTVSPNEGLYGEISGHSAQQQWYPYADKIKRVQFTGYVNSSNCSWMFSHFSNVEEINLTNFTTNGATDMQRMFAGCSKLTSLDLSGFDTSKVSSTYEMFTECHNLQHLNMEDLDFSSLDDAGYMFCNCTGLYSLYLSGLKFDSLLDVQGMFWGCSNIKILDISSFNLSGKGINTVAMINGCTSLEKLCLGPWDMSRVVENDWYGKAVFPKKMSDDLEKEYKAGETIPDSKKPVTYYAPLNVYDSGFVIGKDSNAFHNNHGSFWPLGDDPYMKPVRSKYLDNDTLDRLTKNQSKSTRYVIKIKNWFSYHDIRGVWAYCYGMSATMALLKNGDSKGGINSKELAGVEDKRYYALGVPREKKEKNRFNDTFGEMIRYYQMSQWLGIGGKKEGLDTENGADMNEVMAEAIDIAKSNKVGIIKSPTTDNHSVIFTKCREFSDTYELSIFDVNTVETSLSATEGANLVWRVKDKGHYQTLVIPKDDYSKCYVIDDSLPDGWKYIFNCYVVDPSDIIRPDGSLPPNKPEDTEETSVSFDVANNIGYEITLQNGKKVIIEDNEITAGREEISWVSRQETAISENPSASTITLDFPQQKYISIKMTGDKESYHTVLMVNDKGAVSLSGQNISSALLTPGEDIEINGADYTFEAMISTKEMISEYDSGMGSVSANTSGNVIISNPQGNTLDIASDNALNDVQVYSYGITSRKKEEVQTTSSGLRVDLSTDICEYTDWAWNKTYTRYSRQCVDCGQKEVLEFIAKDKTYDGRPDTKVTVKYNGIVLDSNQYKLTFEKYPDYPGVGKVKYSIAYGDDVFWSSFNINPKGTSIKKLTKGKKSFTIKWKQQRTKTSGYQIQYSLKRNFKNAKTITIKNNKATKKTIKKLKKKKIYYVRVRTISKVSGKYYYSSWSKAWKVKTK